MSRTPRTSAIAAPGTDPELLERVLAWLLRPRRTADALRRACRDRGDGIERERLWAVAPTPSPTERQAMRSLVSTWQGLGVTVAVVGDPAYPTPLAAGWPHTDGPLLLAWLGSAPGATPSIALVGARRATGYGTGVASWLADAVARAGGHVVSGGARGIDAAAHEAAMEQPGGTTVVLGCGHAVAYPREHARPGGLFDRVLEHGGCLVSELLPHDRTVPAHVRARNRVVAGLVDALVVVEGGERSGTLVTAAAAAERGVPVLAVPGDVRAGGSAAPHRLLVEGAAPCRGPDDAIEALGAAGAGERSTGSAATTMLGLPDDVARLLIDAWPRPLRIEELADRTSRPVAGLLATLTQARVAGVVSEGLEGVRLCRAP